LRRLRRWCAAPKVALGSASIVEVEAPKQTIIEAIVIAGG